MNISEARKKRSDCISSMRLVLGLANEKDALAFAILRYILGAGPSIKWGGSPSPLYKSVSEAVGSLPFAVSALNVSYSDSGLFGFLASAPPQIAGQDWRIHCCLLLKPNTQVVEAAVKQLCCLSLTPADIARGKAQLKASVLLGTEGGTDLLEDIGNQAVLLGKVTSPSQVVAAIDGVTSADISAVSMNSLMY
ncbi:unnamed protein product [Timema podura]|uniref:Uncharacterized protein n=1 Tax=Timema podura TaxID=61482 RepID=A0ABN7PD98_TIMPD|nr:unnamed protein product [Timema podura]